MPMTKEDNDLVTRVENGAPLGEMIRQHYWLPAIPSSKLEAGGRPFRVRLLGKNYAAFRAGNGTAGVIDEACPHRKTSMLLARSEEDGLRCIYHGWKINVKGMLDEAPNHTGDQQQFCKHIRTNQYSVACSGRWGPLGLPARGMHARIRGGDPGSHRCRYRANTLREPHACVCVPLRQPPRRGTTNLPVATVGRWPAV